MSRGPKTDLVNLVPILVSLSFGLACAWDLLLTGPGLFQVTPFQEGIGSIGNAAYFVILVGIGATLIYILLTRKKKRVIVLLTGFAMTAASFMLSFVYLSFLFSSAGVLYFDILALVLAVPITILVDYAIFKARSGLTNIAVLLLGGALGTFLGWTIPTYSAVLILVFLAVYDTFAVYRGPVGKIARGGLENLRGLTYSFKDVQMGLGDLTFYSMLSGHMLLWFGFIAFVASLVGILVGSLISFRMVERKGIFPGLPFPVFLGLGFAFISMLTI